jgi:hypothetical protein
VTGPPGLSNKKPLGGHVILPAHIKPSKIKAKTKFVMDVKPDEMFLNIMKKDDDLVESLLDNDSSF